MQVYNIMTACLFLDKAESKVDLNLRAVICLQKSHFTCFVRVKTGDGEKPRWYFHDSMATESVSQP